MTALDLGTTGKAVARNVARRRQTMGYTYAGLETRLENAGHKIPVMGLRRIEASARNVTVDDLLALAIALETSPYALLSSADGPPYGTGVPSDANATEFSFWLKGELSSFELSDRLPFWHWRYETLKNDLIRHKKHVERVRETFEDDLDYVSIRQALVAAIEKVDYTERNLEEARRVCTQLLDAIPADGDPYLRKAFELE